MSLENILITIASLPVIIVILIWLRDEHIKNKAAIKRMLDNM